jgi:hypothetical protein
MDRTYNSALKRLDNYIKRLEKIKKTIKIIDTKYKDKIIHCSFNELKLNNLINKNNILESRYTYGKQNNYPNIYQNPYGLWVSCGSNWIKWLITASEHFYYNTNKLDINSLYIYEIILNNKNILYINNLDELIIFHQKYAIYEENKGYDIDWVNVKKIYDGLIICPYLGYEIWNKINDPTILYVTPPINKYIKDGLKENIMKYPKFYLEWYRHWETSTGVIWRERSIKKIKLIKI